MVFYMTSAQLLYCTFRNDYFYGYTCDIHITNPSGNYSFSRILGTHWNNKTNEDVKYIRRTDDSNTTNVPYIICETFQNATRFDMYAMRLTKLNENAFWECKSLQYLDLSNNQIVEILPSHFESLVNLEILILSYNNISKIDAKAFSSLTNLKTLRLNNNKIIKISEIFEPLENLTNLYSYNNQIEEVSPKIFSALVNLEVLDLSNNNILKIYEDSFESQKKLKEIYLYSNQIEELPRNFLNSSKQLIRIYLNHNKLKIVHSFGLLPKLVTVLLNNNQIDAFDQDLIDDSSVTILDMRNNLCANANINDTSVLRLEMRRKLLTCFQNYANLIPGKKINDKS